MRDNSYYSVWLGPEQREKHRQEVMASVELSVGEEQYGSSYRQPDVKISSDWKCGYMQAVQSCTITFICTSMPLQLCRPEAQRVKILSLSFTTFSSVGSSPSPLSPGRVWEVCIKGRESVSRCRE